MNDREDKRPVYTKKYEPITKSWEVYKDGIEIDGAWTGGEAEMIIIELEEKDEKRRRRKQWEQGKK